MQREELITQRSLTQRTIISLVVFLLFIGGCIIGWKWLQSSPKDQGALQPLRNGLSRNESVFLSMFNMNKLTATYPVSMAAANVRVNGKYGIKSAFDSASWRLHIITSDTTELQLTLDDLKKLPKTEIVFDFKCIEGWSQVSHWGGVKFSDLINRYGLQKLMQRQFTGLETPDKEYYVGIDNKSMMHPQTLLAYELNGQPLPMNNGYPLRLIIPVKYGVKHLKRIGTIFFSDARPADFWYEQGYDYYCGL